MSFFAKIRQEIAAFLPQERYFVLFAMAAAFAINCEYGITRPASNGLLLTLFSTKALPWIWLATVPFTLLIVKLYNRYLPRIGPIKTLGLTVLFTIAVNTATPLIIPHFPHWICFQFIWKDVYVLLMFKQLWSLIHSTTISARAKYLYGLIYAMGTVGAVAGGIVPSFFAVHLGSEQLYLFTLPIYLFFFLCYRKAMQCGSFIRGPLIQELTDVDRPKGGFSIVRSSPFLLSVLLLVLCMQISVGFMEFQFNAHLELNILEKDLRTEYTGRMISLMNLLSGGLQLVGSFLIVHFLGLKRSHVAVPLFLLANVIGCMVVPSFAWVSFAFVFTKAVDFSLFGVIREMLYIPLKTEEKFHAKAVIDVFVHRSAKAFVSIYILGFQLLSGNGLLAWIGPSTAAILIVWVAVAWFMLRKHVPSRVV